MLVLLAVVVVDVQGADAFLHDLKFVLHAFHDVGMADIEDKSHIEVGDAQENSAIGRRRKGRWGYFPAEARRRAGLPKLRSSSSDENAASTAQSLNSCSGAPSADGIFHGTDSAISSARLISSTVLP